MRGYNLTYESLVLHSFMPHCKNCGHSFSPYRSWQEFCSPACRAQHYERNVRRPYARALRELDRQNLEDEKNFEDEEAEGEKNLGEG